MATQGHSHILAPPACETRQASSLCSKPSGRRCGNLLAFTGLDIGRRARLDDLLGLCPKGGNNIAHLALTGPLPSFLHVPGVGGPYKFSPPCNQVANRTSPAGATWLLNTPQAPPLQGIRCTTARGHEPWLPSLLHGDCGTGALNTPLARGFPAGLGP